MAALIADGGSLQIGIGAIGDAIAHSLILRQEQFYTMPIKMKVFNGTYMNNWELLIPALLLTILPLLVVYFIAQKSIIEGVTQGSVKG